MTVDEYNNCVDSFADGVYRFVLKNIKDEDKARDIIQDTFEKMWRKASDIQFEKGKSYLFTTAYHTMIDLIRKEKRQVSLANNEYEIAHYDRADSFDLQNILTNALRRLPEIQRSVILLRDYEGYSYQEIGEITGLNESQVKVYIYRARMFLKNFIVKLENVV